MNLNKSRDLTHNYRSLFLKSFLGFALFLLKSLLSSKSVPFMLLERNVCLHSENKFPGPEITFL